MKATTKSVGGRALVGLAFHTGEILPPEASSGGWAARQANTLLRTFGFTIEAKGGAGSAPSPNTAIAAAVETEPRRREAMWSGC